MRCTDMTQGSSTKAGREVELKLTVPEAALAGLLQHSVFRRDCAAEPERRRQVTTYFDTLDRALSRCRISLRVRRSGDRRVQTVKADEKGGVAADRGEWEWPIKRDTPDLGLLAHTPIAARLPDKLALEPVVVTEIERTVRLLKLDAGAVVEAALDTGVIIAGDRRQPVRELELELRAGEAAALFRLALELHAAVPMTIESQSKAARGYRLQTGERPAARKAEDVALRAASTGAEAFRRIVTNRLGHLLVNQPAALGGDHEGVHQMRVAIRQLRAALTLFQPLLEPHAVSRFQAELRRIGRVFGEARDWDVFTLQILPETLREAGAAEWSELLRQPAMAQREAAHRRFVQEVQAPAFTALVLGLAAWAEQEDLLGGADLQRAIEALYPALLGRLARKVERRGRRIGRGSDAERHRLRKSLKKLRYGIDDLRAVLPPKAAAAYLRRCKKLQRILGDANDAVTGIGLADRLDADARPDLAPAVGLLAKRLERRRSEGLQDLAKRWKAFRGEPRFWS